MDKLLALWNIIISLLLIRGFIMKKCPHIKTYYLDFGKHNIHLWRVENRYESGGVCSSTRIFKIGFGNW